MPPINLCVCMCIAIYLLVNGSIKKLKAETNKHAKLELLDASFCMRSVSYQRKVGDWVFPEPLVFKIKKVY
jgi:hypothetical protein